MRNDNNLHESLYSVEDMARLLHKTVSAIYTDIARRPNLLPPNIDVGSKRLLWLKSDVDKWLRARPRINNLLK